MGLPRGLFTALKKGSCFCLSGLAQGLKKDINKPLKVIDVASTLVWGNKDHSHRNTDFSTITEHLPHCNIVEFNNCGHFPELENTKKYVGLVHDISKDKL